MPSGAQAGSRSPADGDCACEENERLAISATVSALPPECQWDRKTSELGHYNDLMLALRYVYILALAVWLGGMLVLGAIVAPTTFQVLQASAPESGRLLAGDLFGVILERFHYLAYGAGAVLLASLAAMALLGPRPRGLAARMLIVATMLLVALYSGIVVLGEIDAIQQAVGGLPSSLPADDPRRMRFDELHAFSTQLMIANIIGSLGLLCWETRE